MVATIVLGVLGGLLILGFLHGVVMGMKKSIINVIWTVLSLVLVLMFTGMFTNFFMNFNLGFLNLNIQGQPLTTIKEFIITNVTSQTGLTAQEIQSTIEYLLKIVNLVLGGVVALVLFLLLQIVYIPVRIIISIFARTKKGKSKHRFFGGLIGVVSGALVFLLISMPVSGYLTVARKATNVLKQEETIENAEMITKVDDVCNQYFSSPAVTFLNKIGVGAVQMQVFNGVTTVKINDKDVALIKESENLAKIFDGVTYLKGVDFNGVLNGNVTLDNEKLATAFEKLMSSELIKGAIPALKPLAVAIIGKSFEGGESGIDAEAVKNVVSDVLTGLSEIDGEKIKTSVTAISQVITEVGAATKDIDNVQFANIGDSFDKIISTGLMKEASINSLIGVLTDKVSEAMEEGNSMKNVFAEIKTRFASGVDSYKTEFTALDKLMDVVPLVQGGVDIKNDGAEIGRAIDNALKPVVVDGANKTCKVINESLISDFVVSAIDTAVGDTVNEGDLFYQSIEDVKAGIKKGGLNYEKEFSVIVDLLDVKDNFTKGFDISENGVALGTDIDNILAKESKIITRNFVNDLMGGIIDDSFKTVNGDSDFREAIDNISARLKGSTFSFKDEFTYLGKVSVIAKNATSLSLSTLNKPQPWGENKTIGKLLDEIAPSVLVGDMGINAINKAFTAYKSNTDNLKFAKINDQIAKNFTSIKNNMQVCGKTDGHTYSEVTEAFYGLFTAMSGENESDKITGKTDFTIDIASVYETKLDLLQKNLIMGENGTRALASFVTGEVKNVVISKKLTGNDPISLGINTAIDGLCVYIDGYINYLNREIATGNPEPYNDTTELYVDPKNNFAQSSSYAEGYIRVNKPFSIIIEKLNVILGL